MTASASAQRSAAQPGGLVHAHRVAEHLAGRRVEDLPGRQQVDRRIADRQPAEVEHRREPTVADQQVLGIEVAVVPPRLHTRSTPGSVMRLVPRRRDRVEVEVQVGDAPALHKVARACARPWPPTARRDTTARLDPEVRRWYVEPAERPDRGREVEGQVATDRVGRASRDPPPPGPPRRANARSTTSPGSREPGSPTRTTSRHRHRQRRADVGQPSSLLLDRPGAARLARQPYEQVRTEPEQRIGRTGARQPAQCEVGEIGEGTVDEGADQGNVDRELVVMERLAHRRPPARWMITPRILPNAPGASDGITMRAATADCGSVRPHG